MTRSSRQREKYGNGNDLSGASAYKGSAARTRPFSLEEIMTRRKNKKSTADTTERADPGDLLRQDTVESVSDHPEHDKRSTPGKESSHVIAKKDTENTMKRSRKDETTSLKERSSVKVGDKESHDSETKLKDKLANETGRVKDHKNEKQSRHKSRYQEHPRDDTKSGRVTDHKSEKQSHRRSSNEKHSKNENQSRHRTRDEERKNENQSHRKTRDEERPRGDIKTGGGTERSSENHSHHRSSNNKRLREDNGSRKNLAEKSSGKEMYVEGEIMKSERESKRKHRGIEDGRDTLEIKSVVKKHDLRKKNPDPAEKDRKKDTSKSHHEGSSQKRRRSRSIEFRSRDRSNSMSPRAPKRTYGGREHGESSLQDSKDRRHHFDDDKTRESYNGGHTSNQSWRNGGRGNRLGGYSPRKRRSEAAIKTPSPTSRSPERKNAGWDFPPIGAGSSDAISDFQFLHQTVSTEHGFISVVPVTPNAVETLFEVSPSSVSMAKDVTVDTVQLSQTTRSLKTLYVENLPDSVSDKSIMECLNKFLLSLGDYIQGSQPCISSHINKEKGHALVGFLTAEDATKALSFNGRFFSSSVLKIRRPEGFIDPATGVPKKSVPVVDAVSDIVNDSPHKIFIGGISKALSSEMLMEIASSFGHLKAYRFDVNADLKEPCIFLEYIDQTITLKACAGLNGMKLGGQVLTVVQAVPDASVEVNAEHLPFYGIPEHAKSLLSKPTKVLKLKNIFNPEDLSSLSGSEIEEALEDIRIECARFGTVKSIHIVRCEGSCAIANQTDEVTLQDLESDGFTKRTETPEQDIDHDSGENRSEEAYINVKEPLEDVGDLKYVRPTHDIPEEGTERTEMGEKCHFDSSLTTDVPLCNLTAEANPQEAPPQEETSKSKFSSGDELSHDEETGMNKSIMIEAELKHAEAIDGLQEACLQLGHTVSKEPQISKQEKRDDEAFEQGCVFVEYVRSEASCIAAHFLHGRLYGDRTVSVNYIPPDLYLSKFPK